VKSTGDNERMTTCASDKLTMICGQKKTSPQLNSRSSTSTPRAADEKLL